MDTEIELKFETDEQRSARYFLQMLWPEWWEHYHINERIEEGDYVIEVSSSDSSGGVPLRVIYDCEFTVGAGPYWHSHFGFGWSDSLSLQELMEACWMTRMIDDYLAECLIAEDQYIGESWSGSIDVVATGKGEFPSPMRMEHGEPPTRFVRSSWRGTYNEEGEF